MLRFILATICTVPQFQQFEDTGSNKVYLLYVYSCLCEQYFRKEKKKKELLTKEEKTRERNKTGFRLVVPVPPWIPKARWAPPVRVTDSTRSVDIISRPGGGVGGVPINCDSRTFSSSLFVHPLTLSLFILFFLLSSRRDGRDWSDQAGLGAGGGAEEGAHRRRQEGWEGRQRRPPLRRRDRDHEEVCVLLPPPPPPTLFFWFDSIRFSLSFSLNRRGSFFLGAIFLLDLIDPCRSGAEGIDRFGLGSSFLFSVDFFLGYRFLGLLLMDSFWEKRFRFFLGGVDVWFWGFCSIYMLFKDPSFILVFA